MNVTRLSQRRSWPCEDQTERLIGMGIEKAASFGQVRPGAPDGEPNHQIVQRRHEMTEGRRLRSSRIFMERDIAAIMQPILDAPVLPIDLE